MIPYEYTWSHTLLLHGVERIKTLDQNMASDKDRMQLTECKPLSFLLIWAARE